ncbi:hypothetical protein FCH28_14590 [Streptomyces piniterrae]|uniref:Uncharacterized protein n=1 Tax=Streptomyces piniterrae TaxID=2571125 RepID=A0A4U0NJD6_9ACTN|nr:hypothetical protein [Streptomyces piniterrae]TJZ54367.1 hypothetical protein FCH28_14590 [Streptomyces piniterrae]
MTVFACAGCDAVLSAPVSRVALPVHTHQKWGNGVLLPVLMDPGTYAVDPEPSGPPWRRWSEVGADEAAARGVFAPVYGLSYGAPGAIVMAPGDTRGTVLIPERCGGFCCGLDGRDGPNLACEQCGRAVATRIDDCSLWQTVWFAPDAVRGLHTDEPAGWTTAALPERQGPPPADQSGRWSPQWEAAVGAGLAYLLAASSGTPVAVPDGLVTVLFGNALDAHLPTGTPAKGLALAGPGLPAPDPAPDIFLVPRHPRTGAPWRPSSTARTVPLPAYAWAHLAFPGDGLPVPVTGGLPDGVLRDDPLPMRPLSRFQPDRMVFLDTLARLPAVRQPWLRSIYDRLRAPGTHPF